MFRKAVGILKSEEKNVHMYEYGKFLSFLSWVCFSPSPHHRITQCVQEVDKVSPKQRPEQTLGSEVYLK